jgi:hypothetical protein
VLFVYVLLYFRPANAGKAGKKALKNGLYVVHPVGRGFLTGFTLAGWRARSFKTGLTRSWPRARRSAAGFPPAGGGEGVRRLAFRRQTVFRELGNWLYVVPGNFKARPDAANVVRTVCEELLAGVNAVTTLVKGGPRLTGCSGGLCRETGNGRQAFRKTG